MTAKSHGLTEECESILEATGLTEEQITLPSLGSPLAPPKPIVPTYKANWPTKATNTSFFEKALLGQVEGLSLEDEPASASNGFGFEDAAETGAGQNGNLIEAEEEDDDAAGWDMGDDIVPEVESDFVNVDSAEAGAGSSEAELWARNSPIAADHVAGGSFETAMQLLNRQVGAVNFEPLKPRFLEIYQASKTYLPASVGLPPLVNYVRRTLDETDSRKVLPLIPRDLESIASGDLQRGYDAMRQNKLEDGLQIFKSILHALLVNAVSDASEVSEAKKIITKAAEYAIAMDIELKRRALGTADLKRSLELSAYFTIPKLEVVHRQLALISAMKFAYQNKNFNSALSFANRILANGGSAKILENVSLPLSPLRCRIQVPRQSANLPVQARKIKAACERNPNDAIDIEFDQFAEFDVCAASQTPIYTGSPFETCAFDGSKFQSKYKGSVCTVCGVCEIGKNGSGLKLFA
jgi:coatomer protein complex subunit alpha (xenin)